MLFDVLVIGGGPGGYEAAIEAAENGLTVANCDNFKFNDSYSLGGTCLNVGCIPSKALLQSSENYIELLNEFEHHGISCENPKIDIKKMIARKNAIVTKSHKGIAYLFKKNKITELHGTASFVKKNNGSGDGYTIDINDDGKTQTIVAKHIIIATGSTPRELPDVAIDNYNILDNEGALSLTQVPKKLCIIGGGVIGLELGSVWSRLGSEVIILEAMPKFLPNADSDCSKELYKNLVKQGLTIHNEIVIKKIKNAAKKVIITYLDKTNHEIIIECDKLIVAIGRVPNIKALVLDNVGVKIDGRGFIAVDDNNLTNMPNIWAIGDCVRGPMLAHKASKEGICVAKRICGIQTKFNFNTIPWVIYTNPELAWVGKTEAELQQMKIEYKVGVSYFMSNGRALGLGNTIGFIKILADKTTDRILGAHMVGPYVSELISEVVVAMEFMASAEDLATIIHAHPSLSEVTHEAALVCN